MAMKPTLITLITALLLAPLAALHAADKPEPVASDDKLAAIFSRKPSGIPLAPILDPGPEFADAKRIWQGSGSMTISPKGRIWLSEMTGGSFEGDRTEPTLSLIHI